MLLLAPLVAFCQPAIATSFDYGDYFGVNPGDVDFLKVKENSITDPVPLYGHPVRMGNDLVFFPKTFASSSSDGLADTTSGTLTMRLRADDGFFLEVITVSEHGGYKLTGVGSRATSATDNGLLTLTDISPGTHGVFAQPLAASPPIYSLPADVLDNFAIETHIDLTGLHISEVVLNFNNNLQTTSQSGTDARIQKDEIIIKTPEPATLGLLALGALAIRRRRFQRNPG